MTTGRRYGGPDALGGRASSTRPRTATACSRPRWRGPPRSTASTAPNLAGIKPGIHRDALAALAVPTDPREQLRASGRAADDAGTDEYWTVNSDGGRSRSRSAATDLIALSHSIHARTGARVRGVPQRRQGHRTARAARIRRSVAGVADLPTAFTATLRQRRPGHRDLRRVRRAAGDRARLRAQHHRGVRGRCRRSRSRRSPTDSASPSGCIGTPAEESGGGKVLMLERGVFDDVAAAMMVHPGPIDIVGRDVARAGRSSPSPSPVARRTPPPRRSSDATPPTRRPSPRSGIGLLRQHLSPGQQMHGIVSDGGIAPNIVPARSEMLYYLRAADRGVARRPDGPGGGLFRGRRARHRVHARDPHRLADLHRTDARSVAGRDAYREADRRPGTDAVGPRTGRIASARAAPTWATSPTSLPGIHPVIGIDSGGAVTHQPEFAAACVTESADRAVIDGAMALARTAVRRGDRTPTQRAASARGRTSAGGRETESIDSGFADHTDDLVAVATAHPRQPRAGATRVRDHRVRRDPADRGRPVARSCCPAERA